MLEASGILVFPRPLVSSEMRASGSLCDLRLENSRCKRASSRRYHLFHELLSSSTDAGAIRPFVI